MAREIKKPTMIKETDVKEFAGEIVIDVTPRKTDPKPVLPLGAQRPVTLDTSRAAQPNIAPDPNLMSFNVWFQKLSASNPKVKLSYKEALEAHCRSMGVAAMCTEEAFNAALKHFGL